jgi:hypothetical protein
MKPQRHQIYSPKEVFELDLLDSPFFMIKVEDEWIPIQTSSLSIEDTIKKLEGTSWQYCRTTNEWIPLFYSTNPDFVLEHYLEKRIEDGILCLYLKEEA